MTDENNELLLDLLIKQATYGLDEAEQAELKKLEHADDHSFDLTAAAVNTVDLDTSEPLPAHLRKAISLKADEFFTTSPIADPEVDDIQPTFGFESKRTSIFSWLGWLVAAAACVALVVNVVTTNRIQQPEVVTVPVGQNPPKVDPTTAHDELMSQPGTIKASWAPAGKDVELAQVSGDVVWNDSKQAGYMKLHGLPTNDKAKSTYQLWIFEENQGDKTPIDGGTFDVDANGDVVIPIDAKLKAKNPAMFAITVEKPGGVVVSKREKIAALAKVETPAKTNA